MQFESTTGHQKFVEDLSVAPDRTEQILFPDRRFVKHEITKEESESIHAIHERIVEDPELFVGAGNSGAVFDLQEDSPLTCIKHVWDRLSVMVKGANYSSLSPYMQKMRLIEQYFEGPKATSAAMMAKGNISFISPNTALVEAGFQNLSREILIAKGFNSSIVPRVLAVNFLESSEYGKTDDRDLPYGFEEAVHLIIMDRVPGKSIQDCILDWEDHFPLIKDMDIEAFCGKTIDAFRVLHQEGIRHQDITLRNIMIDFKTLEPVIIDFGKTRSAGFNFDEDEEMKHLNQVLGELRKFLKDPAGRSADLKARFDEFDKSSFKL